MSKSTSESPDSATTASSTPALSLFLDRTMPHYRQGVLDGACALYSLAMVLDYHQIATPADDVDDGRKSFRRFLKSIGGTDALLPTGLTHDQIAEARNFFGRRLKIDDLELGPAHIDTYELLSSVVAAEKVPVILSYYYGTGSHTAVVTGVGHWQGRRTLFLVCPTEDATLGRLGGTLFNDFLSLEGPKRGWRNKDFEGQEISLLGALRVGLAGA